MKESLLERITKNTKIRIGAALISTIAAYNIATNYTPAFTKEAGAAEATDVPTIVTDLYKWDNVVNVGPDSKTYFKNKNFRWSAHKSTWQKLIFHHPQVLQFFAIKGDFIKVNEAFTNGTEQDGELYRFGLNDTDIGFVLKYSDGKDKVYFVTLGEQCVNTIRSLATQYFD